MKLLLFVFFLLFIKSTEEKCENGEDSCLAPFSGDSVQVSLWKDSSYTTKYEDDEELFSVGDSVYVLCEIISEEYDDHSISHFDTIISRPIPRQPYRASLVNSRTEEETILHKGELCDLKFDEIGSFRRGFHFRIEKEVFDFRTKKGQDEVYVEVGIKVNINHPPEVIIIDKKFHMRIINFDIKSEEQKKMKKKVMVYSFDDYFEGLLTLPNARKDHPYEVTRVDKYASMFWYHYSYQAEKRLKKTPSRLISGKYVAINHIMTEDKYIGRKDHLTKTLQSYPDETSTFYPKTYILSYYEDRTDFFSHLTTQNEEEGDQIWILKASGLSEGRGTRFITKINNEVKLDDKKIEISSAGDLMNLLKSEDDDKKSNKIVEYIAQKYISNPVLYKGYKIGIRQFFLIASIHPLRVLVYDTGFCTFGSSLYENVRFDDMTIHLTNYDQQPAGDKPEFMYVKETFDEYNRQKGEVEDHDEWYENTFRRQVKNSIVQTTKSYNRSSHGIMETMMSRNVHFFGLYAADYIMDDDHVLWLNEIQRSPSLRHTGTCLKSEFMPEMMLETLDIVNEIRRFGELHAGKTSKLKDLKSVKKYEWVINEAE